jgi:integrase
MSKRGNGEGNLRLRDDGRWQASTLVAAADGTRKRHYVYGASRAEVQGKLDDIRQRVRGGQPAVDVGVTLGAYLDRWLIDGLAEHKATTRENYTLMVRKHITPAIGSIRLDRLSPLDVQSLVNAKRATHSASTVRLIFSVLHRALEQAVEWELMARNPAAKVKRPKAGEPHDRFLSPEEAAQLLATARGTRLYALVAVALSIGLRRGEALALRWSDVDLDGGSLTVRRTLSRVGNGLTFTTPKSGKSRTVPLPAPSLRILQEHRQALIAERLALGPAWTDLDLVFPSRLGTAAEPRNVQREFHALVARAGLPAARFHTLRHSCGALLVAQGVHLQVIAEILGHSDIRVTSAVYAHVGERLQRDAAERMASALDW